MKSISHYGIVFVWIITIFFSLLIMNVVSFMMQQKLNKKDEDAMSDSYSFSGCDL